MALRSQLRSSWRGVLGASGFPLAGASMDMSFYTGQYLGAQVSDLTVSRASTAYAETTEGTLVSFGSNVARITNKGLLVEEARTNIAVRSQEIDNASWSKGNTTVVADATAAPDGTTTADQITDDAVSAVHFFLQSQSFTSGTTYTQSVYAKAGTNDKVQILLGSAAFSTLVSANFNLTTGTVTQTTGTIVGATIQAMANGWYRCTLTAAADASAAANIQYGPANSNTMARNATYVGTGTTVFFWGAQVEAGAFVTSYIPTTSGSVTRAGDDIQIGTTPFAVFYTGGAAGTFYAEGSTYGTASANPYLMRPLGVNANERIDFDPASATGMAWQTVTGGATQAGSTIPIQSAANVNKVIVAYNTNDVNAAANGTLATQDTSATTPTLTRMHIGQATPAGNNLNGYLRRIAYFPSRLADATLSALTAASATLDMNFTTSSYTPSTAFTSLTVSRASTAYSDDTSGTWTAFSSNVARVTNKGLLVEESRTNSLRNNSTTGAVVGSPGTMPTNWAISGFSGLSPQVVGTGTQNGIDYVDIRLSGTAGGTAGQIAMETNAGIAATNGQAWANSAFLSLVGGSFTNVTFAALRIFTYTAGFAFSTAQSGTSIIAIDSSFPRFSNLITISDASAAFARPVLDFTVTNGAAVDFTVRIGWPQCELGAFATSPIRTTAAAVTRAADVISLQSTAFSSWFTAAAATFVIDYLSTTTAAQTTANPSPFAASDNTGNNRLHCFRTSSTDQFQFRDTSGGVASTPGSITVSTQPIATKLALAHTIATNGAIGAANGTLSTAASPAANPVGCDRLYIGASEAGVANGGQYIRRVTFYPARFPDAVLQTLTT